MIALEHEVVIQISLHIVGVDVRPALGALEATLLAGLRCWAEVSLIPESGLLFVVFTIQVATFIILARADAHATDSTLSKRTWEAMVQNWRRSLKRLACLDQLSLPA